MLNSYFPCQNVVPKQHSPPSQVQHIDVAVEQQSLHHTRIAATFARTWTDRLSKPYPETRDTNVGC